MNVDLSNTFKDGRNLLNSWKLRYSPSEYPYKVVLNIFYRKYTIEKMWPKVINNKHSTWQRAYEFNMLKYSEVAQNEIVPVLENWVQANKKVGMIKFSDFQPYIQSSAKGNSEALKGLEYTYLLHRILDELIVLWISFINSGETQVDAIAKLTRAIVEINPINKYEEIENIFDKLGAEQYLQSLFIKEINGQL